MFLCDPDLEQLFSDCLSLNNLAIIIVVSAVWIYNDTVTHGELTDSRVMTDSCTIRTQISPSSCNSFTIAV